jgi:hypothetical protein
MPTPEGKVKTQINKALKALHGSKGPDCCYYVYRFMPVQNGMGIPGLDYFLCINGHFVAIEAKAKGKKPTPRQLQTMEEIRAAEGITFVVDDKASLDEAISRIMRLCRV